MDTKHKGFTLIELMIVIAIVAILSSLAISFYNYYSGRAKMGEVLTAFSTCKTAITEAANTGLKNLASSNGFGCENLTGTTQYVASITTNDTGNIIIVPRNINSSINGKQLFLTPYDNTGNKMSRNDFLEKTNRPIYSWRCKINQSDPITAIYLPADCR